MARRGGEGAGRGREDRRGRPARPKESAATCAREKAEAYLDATISANSQPTALAAEVIAHRRDEADLALVARDLPSPRRVRVRITELAEIGMGLLDAGDEIGGRYELLGGPAIV